MKSTMKVAMARREKKDDSCTMKFCTSKYMNDPFTVTTIHKPMRRKVLT